jgi:hypothetical protein
MRHERNGSQGEIGNERRLMLASLRHIGTFTKLDGPWLFAERQRYP